MEIKEKVEKNIKNMINNNSLRVSNIGSNSLNSLSKGFVLTALVLSGMGFSNYFINNIKQQSIVSENIQKQDLYFKGFEEGIVLYKEMLKKHGIQNENSLMIKNKLIDLCKNNNNLNNFRLIMNAELEYKKTNENNITETTTFNETKFEYNIDDQIPNEEGIYTGKILGLKM